MKGLACLRVILVAVVLAFVLACQGTRADTTTARTDAGKQYYAHMPAVTQQSPVTFAVIGDYGSANGYERAVAMLVKSWSPAFIVTVGDNNYPSGASTTIDANVGQYYANFIYPYTGAYSSNATVNRFFPTLGNHDWLTTNAAPYLSYFTLPGNERYYDVVRGPVHLFALDSDRSEPDGTIAASTQGTWLQSHLAASTACWKLVFLHHAPYSSAAHGSNTTSQWPYQAWGASAVLAGHDHTYERILVNGFPYFVNGAGGSGLYAFGAPIAGSIVRYNALNGAMRITATRSSIVFQFINVNGVLIDTHTLNGGCS